MATVVYFSLRVAIAIDDVDRDTGETAPQEGVAGSGEVVTVVPG